MWDGLKKLQIWFEMRLSWRTSPSEPNWPEPLLPLLRSYHPPIQSQPSPCHGGQSPKDLVPPEASNWKSKWRTGYVFGGLLVTAFFPFFILAQLFILLSIDHIVLSDLLVVPVLPWTDKLIDHKKKPVKFMGNCFYIQIHGFTHDIWHLLLLTGFCWAR